MDDKEIGIKIDPEKYYTYEEVGTILGIGEKTIRKRVKEGRLIMSNPARNKCLFSGRALINLLEENSRSKSKRQ